MVDDFEIDEDGFDGEEEKTSLKDLWNNNPVFKIAVIVVLIVGLYTVYSVFFAEEDLDTDFSMVGGASTVTSAPGEESLDPVFKDAITAANEKRAADAQQGGGSSLPTPVADNDGNIDVPDLKSGDDDPLSVWKRTSEAVRISRGDADEFNFDSGPTTDPIQSQQALAPVLPQMQPTPPKNVNVVNPEIVTQFSEQMRTIIGTKQPKASNIIQADYPSAYAQHLAKQAELKAARSENASSAQASNGALGGDDSTSLIGEDADEGKVLAPAGAVVYAQLLTALNSDIESPVLVHILSGYFAGGRAIGKFERMEEYLVLEFETFVKDGVSYDADGFALDADTTLGGLRTDVDRHWFRRVILPAAAEFVSGVGSAIAETNQTSVSVDGGAAISDEEELDTQEELASGVAAGTDKISEILSEEESVEVTVTLDKGTPIGILLIEPIREGDAE